MSRTYTKVPEPRYVQAANQIIPGGLASGTPVDVEKLVAQQVPTLVTGKYLHTKTVGDKVVMEWADTPAELPALPSGASEKTFVLKAVNGTLTWVEET